VRERQIADAQRALKSVAGNAALLLHDEGMAENDVVAYIERYGLETPERARHRFSFIANPLWRAYVFTYHVGHDLLGAWLDMPAEPGEAGAAATDATPQARRQARFARLLADQVTPSAIQSQVGE